MEHNFDFANNLLPIEILQEIFKHLTFRDLETCTKVCLTWELAGSTLYKYAKECEKLLKSCCDDIYNRAKLSWYELYTSLSLWPNIRTAKVSRLFSIPVSTEKLDFYNDYRVQYLKDGIISYPSCKKNEDPTSDVNTITYFDTKTLKVVGQTTFEFSFVHYEENQDLIVFLLAEKELRIITKANMKLYEVQGKILEQNNGYLKFYFCKDENKVFYINLDGCIVMAYCVKELGSPKILFKDVISYPDCLYTDLDDEIIAISYKEDKHKPELKFMTNPGKVYTVNIKDSSLEQTCVIEMTDNIGEVLDSLRDHGFEWTNSVGAWLSNSTHKFDSNFLAGVQYKEYTAEPYSNILFVGADINDCEDCSVCHVHVYSSPPKGGGYYEFYTEDATCLIDLIKLFPTDLAEIERSRITGIGVIELKYGHRLVVEYGGLTKIFIIDVKHELEGERNSRGGRGGRDYPALHSQYKYCGSSRVCSRY